MLGTSAAVWTFFRAVSEYSFHIFVVCNRCIWRYSRNLLFAFSTLDNLVAPRHSGVPAFAAPREVVVQVMTLDEKKI